MITAIDIGAERPNPLIGFFAPWAVYLMVLALQLIIPARKVEGYVRDESGAPLRYRLNGLRVFAVVLAIYTLLCRANILPWDFFWLHRFESLAGACTLGLLFTFAIVVRAPPTGRSLLADLYLGRRENPQLGRGLLDAKMSLYLIGAVMLALNLLSFSAHQILAFPHLGQASRGILLYAALFLFFVSEYLFFEEVHLYTYDFFAERVGFKLGWGCLTFYPFFYCIGLWEEAGKPNSNPPLALLILAGLLFFSGWTLSRGANLQKFVFKRDPQARFLGIKPEVITDGSRSLLCSGFWRASRHINYLGEILMAIGLSLSLGRPLDILPWLYPLYYLALLLPRQRDDDQRCARKYSGLWIEYCRRVRYRIIPGLY